jgi:hypothetical protein
MPCIICGNAETVRSHILPKAVAKDLRRGAAHVVQGSSIYDGVRKLPGGVFSDRILCDLHEKATSTHDTYGVAFLRRAKEAFDAFGPETFWVENPEPQSLSKFVASVIWREVHSFGSERLGPYEKDVRGHVFSDGKLSWPMMVWRDFFTLDEGKAIEFNIHPYRTKFIDRNAWMFTALGFSFIAICDKRGTAIIPEEMIANRANPLRVMVGHPMNFREVPTLKPIHERMRKGKKNNGRHA